MFTLAYSVSICQEARTSFMHITFAVVMVMQQRHGVELYSFNKIHTTSEDHLHLEQLPKSLNLVS